MTAFTSSNLPSDINTVEKLVAWGILVLRETAPTNAISEAVNVVNFQADVQESISPDGKPIFAGRVVFQELPLSSIAGKRWNAIQPIPRSADIPSYYTTA